MVNMPINVSAFPTDELGLVTDINQNYNQEYYEWLLKQHNYFPDCAFHKVSEEGPNDFTSSRYIWCFVWERENPYYFESVHTMDSFIHNAHTGAGGEYAVQCSHATNARI